MLLLLLPMLVLLFNATEKPLGNDLKVGKVVPVRRHQPGARTSAKPRREVLPDGAALDQLLGSILGQRAQCVNDACGPALSGEKIHEQQLLQPLRIETILPNGVEESALFPPSAASGPGSRLAGGPGLGNDLSDGEGMTPGSAGGSSHRIGAGLEPGLMPPGRTRTSAIVLLDAVHSHTAAVVTTTGCVRLVTDVASRSGVRLATAFPGVSSTIEHQSVNGTIHGGGSITSSSGSPSSSAAAGSRAAAAATSSAHSNTTSVAAYQPLGQRFLVTGEGCRYALWDLGQQRKIDERAAMPPLAVSNNSHHHTIICATAIAASPESFCLGLTRSIVVTDHRIGGHAVGTLHIPEAFGGAGCVAISSHPTAPSRITGVSYSGLTCVWDLRYGLDIGDNRAVLAGYGAQQLRPGMSRAALPRSAHLPGVLNAKSDGDGGSSSSATAMRVSTAAIHPLFADAPLIAAGVGTKFRIMLPEQVLASRNEQPVVCSWHPFEILGAVVPWTADLAARKLEIFSAASREQRADHLVDLIL